MFLVAASNAATATPPWWVSPLVTLVGVVVAQAVTLGIYWRTRKRDAAQRAREEQQRWDRELRELCGRVSAVCLRIQLAISLDKGGDELTTLRIELETVMAEIEVVAPNEAYKATQRMWVVAVSAVNGRQEDRKKLGNARNAYVEEVRRLLGRPQLWEGDFSDALPSWD